jgi:parallel beta-helix repeat protein
VLLVADVPANRPAHARRLNIEIFVVLGFSRLRAVRTKAQTRTFRRKKAMRTFRSLGVACFLFLSFAYSSRATTRYVDVSNAVPVAPYTNWGKASTNIQMAIDVAASGDEILVAPGTYLSTGSAVLIPANMTVTLRSTHSRAAIIDAQGLSQGLIVYGTNSLVEGFTIRNGVMEGNYGGGVVITTSGTVRDCLVVSNRTTAGAGGIWIYGPAIVENCTIQGNRAFGSGGGAVFYSNSRGLMKNCMISDNLSSNYGGGVWISQGGTVSNCWISGNRSILDDGGGVYMTCEGTTNAGVLVNSVIANNAAAKYGGGVYSIGPVGTLHPIVNCTIVSNSASQDGGGVYAMTTRFINDIIYFNSAPTNANLNAHDSILSCIVSNCCTTSTNYPWPCITNAPTFVNAAAGDFRLATASFGIDAGTTNGAPRSDIEGKSRPRIGLPGLGITNCDMGAYEYDFHFNDISFTSTTTVQFRWDVQDRGIYRLDAETNGTVSPPWIANIAGYTNPGMAAGQFMVHTQTVVISNPVPARANFRLRISHTLGR